MLTALLTVLSVLLTEWWLYWPGCWLCYWLHVDCVIDCALNTFTGLQHSSGSASYQTASDLIWSGQAKWADYTNTEHMIINTIDMRPNKW